VVEQRTHKKFCEIGRLAAHLWWHRRSLSRCWHFQ
jgi:hypothetical protein